MTGHVTKYTVPEVLPLAKALIPVSGCCLHIVLDDGNIDNGSVAFCIEDAVVHGHKDCERLARMMLTMSRTQRRKVYALCRLP